MKKLFAFALLLFAGIVSCHASPSRIANDNDSTITKGCDTATAFNTLSQARDWADRKITDIIDRNGFVSKPKILSYSPYVVMAADDLCGGDLDVGGMLILHRPFDPASFDSLVDSVAKYAEFISWDMLQDYAIGINYAIWDSYMLSEYTDRQDVPAQTRFNLRKKLSELYKNKNAEPDSLAVEYIFGYVKEVEDIFNGAFKYDSAVQTIWLPTPIEDFWFVLGFLTNGELSYTPGNVMIDKRTFTLVKEWCWVNRNKFRYPVIKKIKNSMAGLGFWYDKETDGPPFPYEKFVKDYDDLRRQVEEMNLIPLSTITEILESIEDTCPH